MAEKRIVVIWIASGLIMGSLVATLFEAVKKNPWLLIYQSFVLGWLLLLTAIATRAPHVDRSR
jgi:hypothetical protein